MAPDDTETKGDALLTCDEAADLLMTSRRAVYRRIQAGKLRAVRLGDSPSSPLRVSLRSLIESVHPAAPPDPREREEPNAHHHDR